MKAFIPLVILFVCAVSANAQAETYTPSSQLEDLALQYAQARCGEIQAGTGEVRANNNDKLHCQYLQEMLVSPCSNQGACIEFGAWANQLNPAISPNDRNFDALLKQRGTDFRRSLSPRKR
ncbi:hypothetical protein [Pseudomonas sp. GXZC]|uniref:hypothetical protein n=1 Tax=Pseudomonas sp. GXZC TaxID=3003351 RepID=UPI0022AA530D|nr:hypothetical protein [Pseudomonas sp. GXZC]WAT32247.1 hypothetical protein OZ428_33770 [Pseudomonas sp. GXZC]